jgi:hypothetical protein
MLTQEAKIHRQSRRIFRFSLGVVFSFAVLIVFLGLPLRERIQILGYYRAEAWKSCAQDERGWDDPERRRHSVSNYFISGILSAHGKSHVSGSAQYHRLMADFALAHFFTASEIDRLFAQTGCGFRPGFTPNYAPGS